MGLDHINNVCHEVRFSLSRCSAKSPMKNGSQFVHLVSFTFSINANPSPLIMSSTSLRHGKSTSSTWRVEAAHGAPECSHENKKRHEKKKIL